MAEDEQRIAQLRSCFIDHDSGQLRRDTDKCFAIQKALCKQQGKKNPTSLPPSLEQEQQHQHHQNTYSNAHNDDDGNEAPVANVDNHQPGQDDYYVRPLPACPECLSRGEKRCEAARFSSSRLHTLETISKRQVEVIDHSNRPWPAWVGDGDTTVAAVLSAVVFLLIIVFFMYTVLNIIRGWRRRQKFVRSVKRDPSLRFGVFFVKSSSERDDGVGGNQYQNNNNNNQNYNDEAADAQDDENNDKEERRGDNDEEEEGEEENRELYHLPVRYEYAPGFGQRVPDDGTWLCVDGMLLVFALFSFVSLIMALSAKTQHHIDRNKKIEAERRATFDIITGEATWSAPLGERLLDGLLSNVIDRPVAIVTGVTAFFSASATELVVSLISGIFGRIFAAKYVYACAGLVYYFIFCFCGALLFAFLLKNIIVAPATHIGSATRLASDFEEEIKRFAWIANALDGARTTGSSYAHGHDVHMQACIREAVGRQRAQEQRRLSPPLGALQYTPPPPLVPAPAPALAIDGSPPGSRNRRFSASSSSSTASSLSPLQQRNVAGGGGDGQMTPQRTQRQMPSLELSPFQNRSPVVVQNRSPCQNRSPVVVQNRSPCQNRSPVVVQNRSPCQNRSPVVVQNRSPCQNRSPVVVQNRSPCQNRSPVVVQNRSPCQNRSPVVVQNRSPCQNRSPLEEYF